MGGIIQYVYGAMWMLIAVILVLRFTRESKWFYLAGAWFAAFSIITIVNEIMGGKLLNGALRWIFQGISAVVSIILIIVFLTEGRRSKENFEAANQQDISDGISYDENADWQDQEYDTSYDASYDTNYDPTHDTGYNAPYEPQGQYQDNENYDDRG